MAARKFLAVLSKRVAIAREFAKEIFDQVALLVEFAIEIARRQAVWSRRDDGGFASRRQPGCS